MTVMAFLLEPYPEDVLNRVEHDYPKSQCPQVMAILGEARDLGWHVPWIQLAALRGASGKIRLLQQWIDLANRDPRDLQMSIEGLAGPGWERDFILYGERGRVPHDGGDKESSD
jgi:hypothetical protein